TAWNAALQTRHSGYYGFGILTETALGASVARRFTTPYIDLPNGNVLVSSDFANGTSGLQAIGFGGTPFTASSTNTSVDLTNQSSWFSADNHHRLKLTTELRRDDASLDQANNRLGTFTFNSLADLQAGRPASYTRQLVPLATRVGELVEAISLGDSYRRTTD